jgi:hypothetical protein
MRCRERQVYRRGREEREKERWTEEERESERVGE